MNEHIKTASDLINCHDYKTNSFSDPKLFVGDLEFFKTIDGELVAIAITVPEGSDFNPKIKSSDKWEIFDKVNNTYYTKRIA